MIFLQLTDELFGVNHRFTFTKQDSIFERVFSSWKYIKIEVENEDSTII